MVEVKRRQATGHGPRRLQGPTAPSRGLRPTIYSPRSMSEKTQAKATILVPRPSHDSSTATWPFSFAGRKLGLMGSDVAHPCATVVHRAAEPPAAASRAMHVPRTHRCRRNAAPTCWPDRNRFGRSLRLMRMWMRSISWRSPTQRCGTSGACGGEVDCSQWGGHKITHAHF